MVGDQTFGALLRFYRRRAGLTQEELAEQSSLSARTISDLERALNQPRKDTVQLLVDALRLSEAERDAFQSAGSRIGEPELFRPETPSGASSQLHPTNLPDEPTSFIGREREIDQIVGLLQQLNIRLVTLTGPGGTGKTRLGLQVADTLLHTFQDGVFFVSLASLADPALVPSAIAEVVGVKQGPGKDLHAELVRYLKQKRLLLVLDNLEHLLDASSVIAFLLDGCRELHMLVTSRIPLHLSREHEYAVPPLSIPHATLLPEKDTLSKYEAVALFIDRARAVRADFTVTEENAPAVAEICVRLDGLPLAIELAAARIKLLPPQALLQRLSNSLKLLTGGARDAPSRQRTLRDAIDWSYSLLSQEEQILISRLTIFAGGCTFEAAEAVCNPEGELDLLEGLASLVDKSLLRQDGNDEPRFSLLETIREFAREKLDEGRELDTLRRRHAEHYGAIVMSAESDLKGEREAAWFERFDNDRENIRAAIDWHRVHQPEAALRMGYVLWQYWWMRAEMRESIRWIEDVWAHNALLPTAERMKVVDAAAHTARFDLAHPLAEALFEQYAILCEEQGDITAKCDALERSAHRLLERGQAVEALQLFEESRTLQRAHNQTDRLHYEEYTLMFAMQSAQIVGEYARATAYAQEGLTRASGRKNTHDSARWRTFMGWLSLLQGDYIQADNLLRESLGVQRELEDRSCMPTSLINLAILALERGKPREAEELVQEGLVYVQEQGQGQTGRAAEHLLVLGRAALMTGELEQADEHYRTGLALAEQAPDKLASAQAIWGLAALAAARRDWQRALQLGGFASALQEVAGYRAAPIERSRYEQTLTAARAHLDDEALDSAWKQGRAMSLEADMVIPTNT